MSGNPETSTLIPTLPTELREAHEAGRLALFCGAGVSREAGYPLFAQLTHLVYDSIPGHLLQPREARALEDEDYDRALHLLERQLPTNQVRQMVVERLTKKPRRLEIHSSLLEIAHQRDGVHLVTTNFDNLFAKALKKMPWRHGVQLDAAPSLPVPKPGKWNSVVHLHGMIDRKLDPTGSRLVLTSGDFGSAYLTEGWASRFIAELVRRYTILFVGYSATDTVMRYVLDAMDADRRLVQHAQCPFAFAEYSNGQGLAEVRDEWLAKGVEPILYPTIDGRHEVLRACLHRWADDWRAGLLGKASVVATLSPSHPSGLPASERERMAWALSDPSGRPARELSTEDAEGRHLPAHFGWLKEFTDRGFLSASTCELEEPVQSSFVGEHASAAAVPLSKRGWAFARWLLTHLDEPGFFCHAASHGGALHPELRSYLRMRASQRDIVSGEADLALAWLQLTSPAVRIQRSQQMDSEEIATLERAIDRWPDHPWVEAEVAHALTPFLRFKNPEDSWRFAALFQSQGHTHARQTKDYLSADLVLRCGDEGFLLAERLGGRTDLLARLARSIHSHLTRALNLNALVATIDASAHVKQIGSHSGTHDGGWHLLVDLVWATFLACDELDPEGAASIYRSWLDTSSVLCHRLAVKAAAEADSLSSQDRLAALLGKT